MTNPAQPPILIGQYIDTYLPAVDGVIITVQNYARWLSQSANSCYIATAAAPRGYEDTEPYPIIRYRSSPISRRPPYRYGLPLLDMKFLYNEHDLSPDLVHAHTPFMAGTEARRIAHLRRIPLVASFHSKYYDDILESTGSKMLAEKAVQLIAHFYNHADYVWTVNAATARTLCDYGYRKKPDIMPNGTDFILPPDPAAASQARRGFSHAHGTAGTLTCHSLRGAGARLVAICWRALARRPSRRSRSGASAARAARVFSATCAARSGHSPSR